MTPLRKQLTTARADLAALEADTPKLQEIVTTNETRLTDLRRAARSGSATFEDVVTQQNRVTASQGLLAQHLQDMANTSALVDELQAAQGAEDVIDEGRNANAEAVRLHEEHGRLAAQLEQQIKEGLKRLDELDRGYRTERGRMFNAAVQHLERVLGVDQQRIRQAMRGEASANIDRATLRAAVADFAGQIDVQPHSIQQVYMHEGPVLLTGAYPLLSKANAGARIF